MSCTVDSPNRLANIHKDISKHDHFASSPSTSSDRQKRKFFEGKHDNNSGGAAHVGGDTNHHPAALSPRKKRPKFFDSSGDALAIDTSDIGTGNSSHSQLDEQEKDRWKRRMSHNKRTQSFAQKDPLALDVSSRRHCSPPSSNSYRRPKWKKDKIIAVPKKYDRHDPLALNAQIEAYQAANQELSAERLSIREQKAERFRYGNYNRYYGYREVCNDPRFELMRKEWFEGRDCLDIGCNTGQFTLSIAKAFSPRMMIGVDIDRQLVRAAQRNIRHYVSEEICRKEGFPRSLPVLYGPIAAPLVLETRNDAMKGFPFNMAFLEHNYVPSDDSQCEKETQEFDTIMALSVTKWIHVNWGDIGLKRFFKRVFRHLRPGGIFILEPQEWHSYETGRNKGKLTVEMRQIYKTVTFKPEEFVEYLTSNEVGFVMEEKRDLPRGSSVSKGFERGLYILRKPESGAVAVQ